MHIVPMLLVAMLIAVLLTSSGAAFCSEIDDASWKGDLAKVTELLKNNPELVNSKDDNGWTPLHNAAFQGNKSMVELLLAQKADVNAKTKSSTTPLHFASLRGFKDVVPLLLAAKANIDSVSIDGETPLHMAAQYGDIDVVKLLVGHKANINVKDNDGQTPLHDAAIIGHIDVVELLVVQKAVVNAKDKYGTTPLSYAVERSHTDIASYLRKNGGKEEVIIAADAPKEVSSKPKDTGSKGAYEVALCPDAYGFKQGGTMAFTPVNGSALEPSSDRQWIKTYSNGQRTILTIHYDKNGKLIYAKWGGF